ncbi:MMPL family transporter [Actinoplanes regularis]|uniref:Putative drug exporter of the RND superfamily n=1 Tax=Actinoplanes regularis TaxID=52697 RepID=A0A239AFF9_9ACTN|nr:MMPL family transporter [Actinoplanes regularis]GIE86896.1 hypothetical protein Are01nite_33760 [Actinoplanes regularis]SNR93748.1 putative drug exporter of the RND superfamily [Actinoplanes regularis]
MFAGWGSRVARFRWPVLIVTLVAVLGAGVWGMGVFGQLTEGGYGDPASESARAADAVAEAVGGQGADVIAIYTPASGGTINDAALTGQIRERLAALPATAVTATTSYWDKKNPAYAAKDKSSAVAIITLAGTDDAAKLEAYGEIEDRFAVDGATVQLAGGAPLAHTSNQRSTDDLASAELISMPIVLVLLLLIFGSLVAASLPVLVGGCAVLGSLGVLHAVALGHDVNSFAVNVASLLGLGMAIDYGLFMVGRFREEQAAGHDPAEAVRRTVGTAGRTVLFSATLLMTALAGLLLFPQGFLKSLAYGGLAAVFLAMLLSLTLLPAILAILGPRVDKLPIRLPFGGRAREGGGWRRLSGFVLRRPVVVAIPILAGLIVLALPIKDVGFGQNDERVLPAGDPSRVAVETLKTSYPQFSSDGVQVVVRGPAAGAKAFAAEIAKIPGVAAVTPAGAGANVTVLNAALTSTDSFSPAARQVVDDLRTSEPPAGTEVLVGGVTARNVDSLDAIADRLPLMIGLLTGATLLLMFLAFGSVLLPIKAVLMSGLSLSATFGLLVWLFQQGHGAGLLHVTPAPLEAGIVVLMAAVVFGLSTDYEVFLLSRMVEARVKGATTAEAVTTGLTRTGRVISAAALLLIVVTGAFALSTVTTMRFVGVGMIIALVLDATVVRMLLVPAVLALLGDAAWWAPGPLRRLQEKAGLAEHAGEESVSGTTAGEQPSETTAGAGTEILDHAAAAAHLSVDGSDDATAILPVVKDDDDSLVTTPEETAIIALEPESSDSPASAESPDPESTTDSGPADSNTTEADPADTATAETDPADTDTTETDLADTGTTETDPADTATAETDPADSGTAETDPPDTGTAETDPPDTGTDSTETDLADTGTAETDLADTGTAETDLADTNPADSIPDSADTIDTAGSSVGAAAIADPGESSDGEEIVSGQTSSTGVGTDVTELLPVISSDQTETDTEAPAGTSSAAPTTADEPKIEVAPAPEAETVTAGLPEPEAHARPSSIPDHEAPEADEVQSKATPDVAAHPISELPEHVVATPEAAPEHSPAKPETTEPTPAEPEAAEPAPEPATAESDVVEPTLAKPEVDEPTASPQVVEPVAEPATAEPEAAKPAAEPEVVKPTAELAAAEPEAAAPATAEPDVVEPATKPATAEPEAAAPATEPDVAEPAAEPDVDEPTLAEPDVDEPTGAEPDVVEHATAMAGSPVGVIPAAVADSFTWMSDPRIAGIVGGPGTPTTTADSDFTWLTGLADPTPAPSTPEPAVTMSPEPASAKEPLSASDPVSATTPTPANEPASAPTQVSANEPASAPTPTPGNEPASATTPTSVNEPISAMGPVSTKEPSGRRPQTLDDWLGGRSTERDHPQPLEVPAARSSRPATLGDFPKPPRRSRPAPAEEPAIPTQATGSIHKPKESAQPLLGDTPQRPKPLDDLSPASPVPTNSVPTNSVPTSAVPRNSVPTNSIPTSSVPTDSVPTNSVPTNSVPTNSVPTNSVPTSSVPTDSVPTNSVSTNSVPTGSAPTSSVPVSSVPARRPQTLDEWLHGNPTQPRPQSLDDMLGGKSPAPDRRPVTLADHTPNPSRPHRSNGGSSQEDPATT